MAEGKDPVAAAAKAVNAALEPLEPEERQRVLDAAYTLWSVPRPSVPSQGAAAQVVATPVGGPRASGEAVASPKSFMAQKKPTADVERVTCLAFYLTHHRNTPQFKTRDLIDLNREAAQPKFANAADAVDNATKGTYKYLTSAGGGKKQITARGDALVQALPNRATVQAALEATPLGGRRRKPKKSSAQHSN